MGPWSLAVGRFRATTPQKIYAGWAQDSWVLTKGLTVDLGLRYDFSTNLFGNATPILPSHQVGPSQRHQQLAAAPGRRLQPG